MKSTFLISLVAILFSQILFTPLLLSSPSLAPVDSSNLKIHVLDSLLSTYGHTTLNAEQEKLISEGMEAFFERQHELKDIAQQESSQEQTIKTQSILIAFISVLMVILIVASVFVFKLMAANQKKANMLQKINEARIRFFINISHDLRTPTSLILNCLEQIKNDSGTHLSKQSETQVLTAARNGERIIHLTDEIKNLINLENDQVKIQKTNVDMDEFLELFVSLFSPAAELKAIDLMYFPTTFDEPPVAPIDLKLFEKVLFNLISNAIKYTPSGGEIVLHLEPAGKGLSIKVGDSGVGIPDEDLPFIFERYYRGSGGDFKTHEGLGIGLSLVKDIVKLHDASISVVSKKNEGSMFEIKLKQATTTEHESLKEYNLTYSKRTQDLFKDLEIERPADLPIVKVETHNELDQINEQTILIVEDHPDIQLQIQNIIAPKYSYFTVFNGKKALDILANHEIDLVITDLMMPWFDGFQLLEKLSETDDLKNIPIIVVSARTIAEDKLKVLSSGANDYLEKPFDSKELLARIENLLNMKEAWSSENVKSLLQDNKQTLNDIERLQLSKIELLISEKIDDPSLTVNYLAYKMQLSERSLYRLVKKISGCSPLDLINEIRMNYANKLIRERRFTHAKEVSHLVGIKNVTRFNQLYKKRFGISPTEIINS